MMSAGGSFWDLGAGSGKLVIAAAMMHNFEVRFNPRQHQKRESSLAAGVVGSADLVRVLSEANETRLEPR